MNGAEFPSPTAEMAEMNRIQYELEYTEGISQRMRIPEMLKVAPQISEDPSVGSQGVPHSVIMQVPERIVVAGWYTVKRCIIVWGGFSVLLRIFYYTQCNLCNLAIIWLYYIVSPMSTFDHPPSRHPFTDHY